MAADVRAENQCMNKLGREGGLLHSLTCCVCRYTLSRRMLPGDIPLQQRFESPQTIHHFSEKKSGAVEVAHMCSCMWLSVKDVGIKRIYGQKELPAEAQTRSALQTTTQSPR